jgi:hypothetical protein
MKAQLHKSLSLFLLSFAFLQLSADDFTPGQGGTLNDLPTFTEIPGKVGGFLITSCERWNYVFSSGTYAQVEMSFPTASSFNADNVTLQYKVNIDDNWQNYMYYDQILTTTGDNFSLTLDGNKWFRIKINGGTKDGWVSNEQYATVSNIDTYFSSWSMDESMYLTGIMSPWVGRGIETSFGVKSLTDGSVIKDGLTYQWYRINPVTYESTPIPQATDTFYITKMEDVGYKLSIKATGNETTVGGFQQIMSNQVTDVPNKAFVNQLSYGGFDLNLYYSVPSLSVSELELRDKDYNLVEINSVINGNSSSATYHINATLIDALSPYSLYNKTFGWKICREVTFGGGQFIDLWEGVSIDLSTLTGLSESNNDSKIFMDDRNVNIISDSKIKSVTITDLSGKLIFKSEPNEENFRHSFNKNESGVMIVKCYTENGSKMEKVILK